MQQEKDFDVLLFTQPTSMKDATGWYFKFDLPGMKKIYPVASSTVRLQKVVSKKELKKFLYEIHRQADIILKQMDEK